MLAPHGDRLLDLCRGASKTVLIVAPFIKDHVLARVFAVLPPTVANVTCITRWFPEEVAAGVSDLEIFDRLSGHPGGRLLLHPHLHAKLYRADRRCLIGSANLTGRGLGWSSPPNIELLVELDAELSELAALEAQLLAAAVPVTAAMRDTVRAAADQLKAENRVPNFSATEIDTDTLSPQVWLPTCTAPDRLWNVYANHEPWQLVTSAASAAALDLLALGPPAGLLRATFNQYIAAALKQMPLVMDIDQRAATGITDEQAVALIAGAVGTDALPYPPTDMWEVLKAWLAHFFPNTYRLYGPRRGVCPRPSNHELDDAERLPQGEAARPQSRQLPNDYGQIPGIAESEGFALAEASITISRHAVTETAEQATAERA